MTNPLAETSPSTRGRIVGALYLTVIIGGIIAQAVIADGLVDYTSASKTAENIRANTSLYRLAFAIFMIEMVAQMATTALFYDLLKPVNKSLARVTTIIGLTGAGIKTLARAFYYSPLFLLGGASWLSAMPADQLETLALVFIKVNNQIASVALVLFGFETLLRGWLVYKSDFMPRILGVISMIGGIGWLTYLWPPLGSQVFMFVALFAIAGVIGTTGWLFIRGIDNEKWKARAALAAGSIWR
jgi:hypothetical protein